MSADNHSVRSFGSTLMLIVVLTVAGSVGVAEAAYVAVEKPVSAYGKFSDPPEIHTSVDQTPEIVGGLSELYSHIEYPRQARRDGVEGRVFIQFVVDDQGNVREPEVIRDIGAGCGEAALDAIREVEFTPGQLNGENVWVRHSLPVTFQLD